MPANGMDSSRNNGQQLPAPHAYSFWVRVLELGAAASLPSLICAVNGAKKVLQQYNAVIATLSAHTF